MTTYYKVCNKDGGSPCHGGNAGGGLKFRTAAGEWAPPVVPS